MYKREQVVSNACIGKRGREQLNELRFIHAGEEVHRIRLAQK